MGGAFVAISDDATSMFWNPAGIARLAVACNLQDRQVAAQADTFEREGGFTDRMYRPRKQVRRK
jgi:four helix bundle suffix protein